MKLHAALCLLMAPGVLCAQTKSEKKTTVAYLQNLQQKDGGFVGEAVKGEKGVSTLRATSTAMRALKYFGAEVEHKDAIAKLIASCFDEKTGGFSDTPGGKISVPLTATGLMAAVEAGMPPEPYAAKATKYLIENAKEFEDRRIAAAGFEAIKTFPPEFKTWLQEVEKLRNDDGSYGKGSGKARMTGSVVAFILRSGNSLKMEARNGALKVLREGQRADGGFGREGSSASDLETTYRVMRAFHLLKESPEDGERLRAYIGQCRNKDGGYGVEPGKPSSLGGTYYAGIILHWLDAKGSN